MKALHMITFTILIVGGLNWGLVGLFNYNIVNAVLSSWPGLVQIVYILVGVSAAYIGLTHMKDCKICSKA